MDKMNSTLLLMLLLCFQGTNAKPRLFMCYYGFGSMDQEKVYYESLDFYMPLEYCTHIIHDYGWFDYQAGSVFLRVSAMDTIVKTGEAYTKVTAQKADVKFLLSVEGYRQFIDDPAIRSKLVTAIRDFLTSTNMDGIDFKLQKITGSCNEETLPNDPQLFSQNFDAFIDELRTAVPDKILMLTIEADPSVTALFNFKHLMRVMDYVNVKAYKSCLHLNGVTGFPAPIYASNEFSMDSAVRQVLEAGVRRSKLIVSMLDGVQNFVLTDPQDTGPGAPVDGAAPQTSLGSPLGIYKHCELCGQYAKYSPSWSNLQYAEYATYQYYVTTDTDPPQTIWLNDGNWFQAGLYVPSMRLVGLSIFSFIHYDSTNTDLCDNLSGFDVLYFGLRECPWSAANWLAGR